MNAKNGYGIHWTLTTDSGFEYVKDGNKEILIFTTNDFFADAKTIEKIRKITGMRLLQMIGTHKRCSQLWFGRYNNTGSSHNDCNKFQGISLQKQYMWTN